MAIRSLVNRQCRGEFPVVAASDCVDASEHCGTRISALTLTASEVGDDLPSSGERLCIAVAPTLPFRCTEPRCPSWTIRRSGLLLAIQGLLGLASSLLATLLTRRSDANKAVITTAHV